MANKKRFIFFGDSWFWIWGKPTSQTMNQYLIKNYPNDLSFPRTSLFPLLLADMGIEHQVFNIAASSLVQSVKIIKEYKPNKNDILILFVSSPVRLKNPFHKNKFNTKDKDDFMDQWYGLYRHCYEQLSDYNDEHDVPLLLEGEHTKVHSHQLKGLSKNIYSIESIAKTLTNTELEFDTFGLQRGLYDWTKIIDKSWDPKLIDFIYDQHNAWDNFTETDGARVFWPDNGHMNHTGQYITLDYIFKILEENKLMDLTD